MAKAVKPPMTPDRIRAILKAANMSCTDLAEACGARVDIVRDWLRRQTSPHGFQLRELERIEERIEAEREMKSKAVAVVTPKPPPEQAVPTNPVSKKKHSPRAKITPVLMSHRKIAALMGMPTRTVSDWIERGDFPPPLTRIGVQYFYRAADANYFLENGKWPASMCKQIGG